MNLNDERHEIVDNVFSNFNFISQTVKDRSGIERVGPNYYLIVFFFDRGDKPSQRAEFHVVFYPESTEVKSANWTY